MPSLSTSITRDRKGHANRWGGSNSWVSWDLSSSHHPQTCMPQEFHRYQVFWRQRLLAGHNSQDGAREIDRFRRGLGEKNLRTQYLRLCSPGYRIARQLHLEDQLHRQSNLLLLLHQGWRFGSECQRVASARISWKRSLRPQSQGPYTISARGAFTICRETRRWTQPKQRSPHLYWEPNRRNNCLLA